MLIADCGLRNADCTISKVDGPIRNPQSEIRISFLPMSVQAIAWSPSGAVHIIDQRALPEAQIERDLESGEAVADAIRTLQVRGALGRGGTGPARPPISRPRGGGGNFGVSGEEPRPGRGGPGRPPGGFGRGGPRCGVSGAGGGGPLGGRAGEALVFAGPAPSGG